MRGCRFKLLKMRKIPYIKSRLGFNRTLKIELIFPNNSMKGIKNNFELFKNALFSCGAESGIFLLMVSSLAVFTISEDLSLQKACSVNYNFTTQACDNIRQRNVSYEKEEKLMQELLSTAKTTTSPVDYGVPILIMLFMGPLSDILGRKIPMLWSIVGYLLQFISLILSAYFPHWDLWTLRFLMSSTRAIGGGEACYNMGASTHIFDKTQSNLGLRTVRTGLYFAFFQAGVPVGQLLGAFISAQNVGYFYGLIFASIPGLIAFLIVVLFVENTKGLASPKIKIVNVSNETESKTECEINVDKETKWGIFFKLLDPRSTWVKIYETLVKRREESKRLTIFLILIAQFCIISPLTAEFTVRYLFLRIQLHWNIVQFGNFSSFATVAGIVGVLLSMGILSHWLKLSDPFVGFVSGISQFTSCFIYAFAKTPLIMYLAPVVDMMNNTMIVVNKSMLSKLVSGDELGNLFAFVGVLESLSPLLMVPIYTSVYKYTLNFFPGAFYLLSAALTIPPFLVLGWLIYADLKNGNGIHQKERSQKITKL